MDRSASNLQTPVSDYFVELQETVCAGLEELDPSAPLREDRWNHRPDKGPGTGGGITRTLAAGELFEKGGVNFSKVTGRLNERLAARLGVPVGNFFAAGVSLVIHPQSPMVPIVHMNVRYLELFGDDDAPTPTRAWFGGGADLTPAYLFEEDAVHFHRCWKTVCDRHDPEYYGRFKKRCDEYFCLPHRNEARGVGGIFFDYLEHAPERTFAFVRDVGNGFLESYAPIVRRRAAEPWSEAEKDWQRIRRGRYVEFNLIHDRGTLFGLETGGRTEAILISMPPVASWVYDHEPEPGSREARLLEVLRQPRDWV